MNIHLKNMTTERRKERKEIFLMSINHEKIEVMEIIESILK